MSRSLAEVCERGGGFNVLPSGKVRIYLPSLHSAHGWVGANLERRASEGWHDFLERCAAHIFEKRG